jgi:large subunit ribosomal protein L2
MTIKIYKRNNAGRRNMSVVKHDREITNVKPEKSLLGVVGKSFGRSSGKISTRHKGGGCKRRYRLVDFVCNKFDIIGRVVSLEKDPNRSALISLVVYADGEKRYLVAVDGMKVGDEIICSESTDVKVGNRMKLKNIPTGTIISSVEFKRGKGSQIVRSAGSGAMLTSIDGGYAHVKMPSGEVRLISVECYATLGQVSNFEHGSIKIGKAGRSRKMGKRPAVRGTAMNPVDHPHGGGEGRQPIGLKYPKTPWGKPALGVKTRKKNKLSNRYIVRSRHKK